MAFLSSSGEDMAVKAKIQGGGLEEACVLVPGDTEREDAPELE